MALSPAQVAQAAKDHADDFYRSLAAKFTSTELSAAAQATDDWIEANAADYNSSLPVAFRTTATAAEKASLFNYVSRKRYIG